MAARKKQADPNPDGQEQASETTGEHGPEQFTPDSSAPVVDESTFADTGPGDIAVDEEFADTTPAPAGHIRVRGAGDGEPARAAGHVLTERGWVPERGA